MLGRRGSKIDELVHARDRHWGGDRFVGINPIDALFYSAVLNGVVAPPLLVLVMLAATNRKVMGDQTIGPLLRTFGWLATAAMYLALGGFVYATSVAR